jgi:hypothetical protein
VWLLLAAFTLCMRFVCICLQFPSRRLSHLPPPSHSQDSTLIMQLLRDNLTLWTSDMQVASVASV